MNILELITPYQNQIEAALKEEIYSLGAQSTLREACEYALLNGGKRFRPALVMIIAEALGKTEQVIPAAVAIEFFHTASLIADDLPCMDNEDTRRGKPCLHKTFGETVALLSTYAFIAAGYEKIYTNSQLLKNKGVTNSDQICTAALQNATYNTGIQGATGGQFLDLCPPEITEESLREIIHKKTITLFEISFVFGWLFGEGEIAKLPLVKKAASHFGMAFQIVDDFLDMEQDAKQQKLINYPLAFGQQKAAQILKSELSELQMTLDQLNLNSAALRGMVKFLLAHVE